MLNYTGLYYVYHKLQGIYCHILLAQLKHREQRAVFTPRVLHFSAFYSFCKRNIKSYSIVIIMINNLYNSK